MAEKQHQTATGDLTQAVCLCLHLTIHWCRAMCHYGGDLMAQAGSVAQRCVCFAQAESFGAQQYSFFGALGNDGGLGGSLDGAIEVRILFPSFTMSMPLVVCHDTDACHHVRWPHMHCDATTAIVELVNCSTTYFPPHCFKFCKQAHFCEKTCSS